MIRVRVRVDNGDDTLTILVCAESLRKAERTAKTRYPESTVRIAFPLDPEYFFVDDPHTGGYAELITAEDLISTTKPT
jgi:hypothetical protein